MNAAARTFFGLQKVMTGPDGLAYSAQDFFGDGIDLTALAQKSAYTDGGDFGEQIRTLVARRRGDLGAVSVKVAVSSMDLHDPGLAQATGGYFSASSRASNRGSKPNTPLLSPRDENAPFGMREPWYSVTLLSVVNSSPASSATLTTTPQVTTPFAQFAASAQARARIQPQLKAPIERPAGSSSAGSGSQSSIFGAKSSVTSSIYSASSQVPTSAGSQSTGASSLAAVKDSELASEPIAGPSRPAPPPSTTSPAAAVIAQIRAAEVLEREQRPDYAEPLASPDLPSRPTSPGLLAMPPPSLPAAASLHPPIPSEPLRDSTTTTTSTHTSNPLVALTHGALAHLPNTGIILASADLSGGYVNDLARELLLGQLPQAKPEGEEWLEDGLWLAQPGPGGRWTWDGAEFFRGLATNSLSDDSDKAGSTAAPTDSVSSAAHSSSEGGRLPRTTSYSAYSDSTNDHQHQPGVIGPPTQLYKVCASRTLFSRTQMTVATILQRSAKLSRARQRLAEHASRGGSTPRPERSSTLPPLTEDAPAPSDYSSRKPYKIYDATFSQRVIDPLEPLLEMCARRGEDPASAVGSDGGAVVVGIEVDMSEAAAKRPDRVATFPSAVPERRVRRRVVEVRGAPIRKPDGTHYGGMLVLRDITDERDPTSGGAVTVRERASKRGLGGDENGSYYKQILDQMPQMVWTTTPGGSHDYFNTQWYDFTGLEPEQSLGLSWQNPFHDEDMPHTIKAWSHSLATGDPYSVEYRCRKHDGSWRWMLGRALPLRDIDGRISGWFGTCTDVEDFIVVRERLAKTQAHLSSALSGADAIIAAVDPDLRYTLFQGAQIGDMLRTQASYVDGSKFPNLDFSNPETIIGHRFDEVFPQFSEVALRLREIARGTLDHYEDEVVNPLTGRTYRISLGPVHETHQGVKRIVGAAVVSTDVSTIRSVESALQKSVDERTRLLASEAAAKEASRLKSEFVANISHETRTPAAGVLGMAELLLDDSTLQGAHREAVEKIFRAGQILLDMLSSILDMGKAEAGKLEVDNQRFHLADVLGDMRIFAASASRKGLEYREEMRDEVYRGPVLGDAMRFRQVLSNLLSNAVKFTSVGSVVFSYEHMSDSPAALGVRVTVRDTGIGIKPEAVSKLFQPFHQADASTTRKFGGTGLGLAIAKSLVELMGGTIKLNSVYGQGTTLTVELSFDKDPTPLDGGPTLSRRGSLKSDTLMQDEQVSALVPTIMSSKERAHTWILVAEDNDLNREIAVKILTRLGFRVDAVADGHAAVAAAKAKRYDLILMDGQMPLLDGYDATRQIRQDPAIRTVKIVALTASAIKGDREKCIDAGMDECVET